MKINQWIFSNRPTCLLDLPWVVSRPLSLDLVFVTSQGLISRSIETVFSVSNQKVNGGKAVQKKWKEEDLDRISCIKRNALCQLQINCHFHFLNFPTVSSPSLIRKILVHGCTLALFRKIWPPRIGCSGYFGPQAEFSGWNTDDTLKLN